ncbi:Vi polysaccharide biosynthesis protein VipA/TviB, partial [Pseudoalteromonas phenolica]
NCPDIRNTKVIDVYHALRDYGVNVNIYDSWAKEDEVYREYGVKLVSSLYQKKYDAIVLAVSHNEFKKIDLIRLKNNNGVVYDVKGFLNENLIDKTL